MAYVSVAFDNVHSHDGDYLSPNALDIGSLGAPRHGSLAAAHSEGKMALPNRAMMYFDHGMYDFLVYSALVAELGRYQAGLAHDHARCTGTRLSIHAPDMEVDQLRLSR